MTIWAPALYVFLTDEYLGNKGIWQVQLRKSKEPIRSHRVIKENELEIVIGKPFPVMYLAHGSHEEVMDFCKKLFGTSLHVDKWTYAGDYTWFVQVSEDQT